MNSGGVANASPAINRISLSYFLFLFAFWSRDFPLEANPSSETAIRVSSAVRIPPSSSSFLLALPWNSAVSPPPDENPPPRFFSLSSPPRVIPFVYDLVPPTVSQLTNRNDRDKLVYFCRARFYRVKKIDFVCSFRRERGEKRRERSVHWIRRGWGFLLLRREQQVSRRFSRDRTWRVFRERGFSFTRGEMMYRCSV